MTLGGCFDSSRLRRSSCGTVSDAGAASGTRKNHLGSKSRRGTEVAASLYSLIESAKLCDVEPRAYLKDAVLAALEGRTVGMLSAHRT